MRKRTPLRVPGTPVSRKLEKDMRLLLTTFALLMLLGNKYAQADYPNDFVPQEDPAITILAELQAMGYLSNYPTGFFTDDSQRRIDLEISGAVRQLLSQEQPGMSKEHLTELNKVQNRKEFRFWFHDDHGFTASMKSDNEITPDFLVPVHKDHWSLWAIDYIQREGLLPQYKDQFFVQNADITKYDTAVAISFILNVADDDLPEPIQILAESLRAEYSYVLVAILYQNWNCGD